MKREPAAEISDAVLYEGYLLYPYRDSAIKNQYRWTFGCLFPEGWCRQYGPSERYRLHTEFLVAVTPGAEVDICLRCLVLPPADQGDGEAQPMERQVVVAEIRPAELTDVCRGIGFQPVRNAKENERLAAYPTIFSLPISEGCAIQAQLTIKSTEVERDVFRISIEVRNITESVDVETRDQAAHHALLSTQLSLTCRDSEFLSLIDPPAHLKAAAAECRNDGCWPVLAGLPGTNNQLLISPIILDDYPQVAPESQGEMFDGTEIDEILTMRIRTLTDDEKAEMADSDPRASELLQRAEAVPDDELNQLHAVMRPASTVPQSLEEDIAPASLRVDGIDLRPGDQVRLHPKGRNDIFDLALAGQTATIATIERDFEDQLYFTVTANCDPGQDFGQAGLPGHRFFFRPEEVEPLLPGRSAET